jgi:hypothetical protein
MLSPDLNFIASAHVDDYDRISRTWKERLWSWPWRPWVSYRLLHNPKFYQLANGTIICSHRSLAEIRGSK